jgi:hypothetical protein
MSYKFYSKLKLSGAMAEREIQLARLRFLTT